MKTLKLNDGTVSILIDETKSTFTSYQLWVMSRGDVPTLKEINSPFPVPTSFIRRPSDYPGSCRIEEISFNDRLFINAYQDFNKFIEVRKNSLSNFTQI